MADVSDVSSLSPAELLALGRRHLAVRDYNAAASNLTLVCELLSKEHGETSDECAEAYLWYGKALLGLAREESGVLGDKIPDAGNEDDEEDEEEENGENAENEDVQTGEATVEKNDEAAKGVEKNEADTTTEDNKPTSSSTEDRQEIQPGPSNGDANDESMVNLDGEEAEEDVDNLQLAWEMLDLSRSILTRRAEGGGDEARGLLAEVHLALGEVALESETYDKAVTDLLSCLEIQKELYSSDNRRIAETHYQIALANSLASNFEEAITHFKNAANILESRIKTLETPNSTQELTQSEIEAEIKEIKELLPEIQIRIQDTMDYKTEVRPCDCVEKTRHMLRDMMLKERSRSINVEA